MICLTSESLLRTTTTYTLLQNFNWRGLVEISFVVVTTYLLDKDYMAALQRRKKKSFSSALDKVKCFSKLWKAENHPEIHISFLLSGT